MTGLPPITSSARSGSVGRGDVVGEQVAGHVAPQVAHRPDGRVEEPLGELVEVLGGRLALEQAAARAPEVAR